MANKHQLQSSPSKKI